eukprot:1145269-Pelagomonas_calceolata.AAC.1
MHSGASIPPHLPSVLYMHATCKGYVSGSTRGGKEGVEGEWIAPTLGWESFPLLGEKKRHPVSFQRMELSCKLGSSSATVMLRSLGQARGGQQQGGGLRIESLWPGLR